jgi:ATP-binding cassette, subfamily B, bacterial
MGKHTRRPPAPAPSGNSRSGESPSGNDLVDRAWEAYDAELSGTRRFAGMTRRLPSLIGYVGRIAWAASRVDTAATVGCDLVSGLLSAVSLLGTTQVLTALFAAGPTPGRLRAALPALLFIMGVTVVRTMLNLAGAWAEDRLVPAVTRVVERRLYAATTEVDLAAFDAPGFYDALQRARDRGLSEAPRVVQLTVSVLTGLVGLAASVSVLWVLSPVLLPLLLVAALPDGWAAVRSARMRYLVSYELGVSRRRKFILADLMADRRAAAEVRSFNMRDFLLRSYDVLATYERDVRLRLARRQSLVGLAGDAAGGAGLGLVYLALGVLLTAGWIGLPVAGTAVLAIQMATSALSGLLISVNQCYESGLYFSDYLDFCTEAEGNRPPTGGKPAPAGFSRISVSGVGFTYPGADRAALEEVSVEIRRGEVIALVGENGSGKSTLAKLLAGLYEPTVGDIAWDGLSLAGLNRAQLRDRIAVIMQDFTRWPMTALDNITMGRPRDDVLLAMATTAAGTDRVIETLPAGYDTHLDRRFRGGTEPSGGQWQRIAIARGFYRDAALLICDEPTSALDPRAEHALFEMIRSHAAGRTVLLITHRLASVRHADRIYVLDHGRVVEHGRHDQLMANGGQYADLYTLQASAYDRV